MPKLKGHKGLAKRVRITGNNKVKFTKRGRRHRNSHMSGDTIRGLNRPNVMSRSAARSLEKMLHIRTYGKEDGKTCCGGEQCCGEEAKQD